MTTAGVVEIGTVVKPFAPRSEIAKQEQLCDDLWVGGAVEPSEIKAGISVDEFRLTPADGMLALADIRKDELLAKMRIVTVRAGSNFLLSDDESRKLRALWRSFGSETDEEIFGDASYVAREGRVREAIHRFRERDHRLASEAKNLFLARNGRLFCEVCRFCFEEKHGDIGRGFIEAHQLKAVNKLHAGEQMRVSDLMMVCAKLSKIQSPDDLLLSSKSFL